MSGYKLPAPKQLRKEDFKADYRELIDRLAFIINPFMNSVSQSYNKGLSIDNLSWEIKELDITCDALGVPTSTIQFNSSLVNKIVGITCIYALNQSNTTIYPTNTPFINFTENNKTITINHVTGLQANNNYKIRIITIS